MRGKDRSPNGLGDEFPDLWFDDLVQAQAIWASFLLESNTGFDRLSVIAVNFSILFQTLTSPTPHYHSTFHFPLTNHSRQ